MKSSGKHNPHRQKRRFHTLRRGMRYSILDGIFAQIYSALCQIGGNFIIKFMVLLNATPFQFAFTLALGQLSAVFQPLGVVFTHYIKKRKWACVWITAIGRSLTFFLGFALFFASAQMGVWFLIALLFASVSLTAIGGNIWIAWMSDLIPLRIRGRFFSRRNQILLLAGMSVAYIFSLYVDMFEKQAGWARTWLVDKIGLGRWFIPANQPWFLMGAFMVATLIGLFGLYFLIKQPERQGKKQASGRLKDEFIQPFKDPNFLRLILFGVYWMLAIGVGSAFWGPFMLTKLKMGLFQMQIYGTLHSLSSLLTFYLWGKFVDRFGNKSAMKIAVFLGGVNPMLWLFASAGNYSILWLEALISGSMWAGHSVVATNFVLAIAPEGKQQSYSGLYSALAGVSMMTSTLISGIFYPRPFDIGWKMLEPEQVLFGIGGILRWLALIPLMVVAEKRSVPLRKVLFSTLRTVMGNVMEYWQAVFKRG